MNGDGSDDLLLSFGNHACFFPAHLVGGFTLHDLLGKSRGHGCLPSALPSRYALSFFIAYRVEHSHCFVSSL